MRYCTILRSCRAGLRPQRTQNLHDGGTQKYVFVYVTIVGGRAGGQASERTGGCMGGWVGGWVSGVGWARLGWIGGSVGWWFRKEGRCVRECIMVALHTSPTRQKQDISATGSTKKRCQVDQRGLEGP